MPDQVIDLYYQALPDDADFLSPEAEAELFRRYRICPKRRCGREFPPGNPQANERCARCGTLRDYSPVTPLFKSTARFCVSIAQKFARQLEGARYSADLLKTLISAGNVGILIAISRFRPHRGRRLTTYAYFWIRERIFDELRHTGLVWVPSQHAGSVVSLDSLADSGQQLTDSTDVGRSFVNQYGAERVIEALQCLELRPRDQYIVVLYFGLREEPKTLREISRRLLGRLSPERVRQIKAAVLVQLVRVLRAEAVESAQDVFGG